MTPKRTQKFQRVAARRQPNLTVILENVHDPHNIGAVLRTCDSVGVKEIFVLYSEPGLNRERLELGKSSSSGARKWIDVNFYTDTLNCFEAVRSRYDLVLATHLTSNAKSLYELNLTASVALLFGNEHAGLSELSLANADGNFIIPQVGMVESLNISVACAVSLYEAYRQRKAAGFYENNLPLSTEEQQALFEKYKARHDSREDVNSVGRLG